jgi:hypothetical protein
MIETMLDPSLAFTAQLELRPGMAGEQGEAWRGALLASWYAQDEVRNLWSFARQYAAAEDELRLYAEQAGLPFRRAVIQRRETGRPSPEEVAAYLPRLWRVSGVTEKAITIEGVDYAGWSFADYVEPRLASGMIFAREVSALDEHGE